MHIWIWQQNCFCSTKCKKLEQQGLIKSSLQFNSNASGCSLCYIPHSSLCTKYQIKPAQKNGRFLRRLFAKKKASTEYQRKAAQKLANKHAGYNKMVCYSSYSSLSCLFPSPNSTMLPKYFINVTLKLAMKQLLCFRNVRKLLEYLVSISEIVKCWQNNNIEMFLKFFSDMFLKP